MDDDNRWSDHLPDELIEVIVKHLTQVDSVRFAAVCRSWRSVSSKWFQRVTRLPWLLRSTRFVDLETVEYSFYSPSEDTDYNLKFPTQNKNFDARNSICCTGSIGGWLIMAEWTPATKIPFAETSINYFLNPMTGDRIKLSQTAFKPWRSSATSDPACSDCIVAFGDRSQLVFCRPGSQASWPWEEHQADCEIHYMTFNDQDGKLYVLVMDDQGCYTIVVLLLVFNQCQGKGDGCEKIIAYREKTILAEKPARGNPRHYFALSIFWSSKGKLLLVWTRDMPGRPFHVLKINDKSGHKDNTNPVWVNSETSDVAEDEVILVSKSHIYCTSVSKSFMTIMDEAFCGLCCGKFFTGHRYDGRLYGLDSENMFYGYWITPNIS